jgi:hypothetical protein
MSSLNERVIGADAYAGGLVVWTEREEPGQSKHRCRMAKYRHC